MKYKRVLIFLIACLLIVSFALVTFIILSNETVEENKVSKEDSYQNINLRENIISENVSNINNSITEENTTNSVDTVNVEEKINKNEIYEKPHIEEQNSEDEISKEDDEQIALSLVKEEWGEDDSVYYTIDRHVGNIYDISVRSKANTQSLMEYEVDTNKKTVELK